MSIKLTITAVAILAVLAGPAFAGDHDLETELRDSGRYVPQANLPDVKMPGMSLPSGAIPTVRTSEEVRSHLGLTSRWP